MGLAIRLNLQWISERADQLRTQERRAAANARKPDAPNVLEDIRKIVAAYIDFYNSHGAGPNVCLTARATEDSIEILNTAREHKLVGTITLSRGMAGELAFATLQHSNGESFRAELFDLAAGAVPEYAVELQKRIQTLADRVFFAELPAVLVHHIRPR